MSSAATPTSVSVARKATTTASFLAARSADRHREPPSLILQPVATSNLSLANRKREHLINQIKEQAAQISDLMSKLEEANRIASRRVSVDSRPIPDICDEGAAAVLAAEDLTGSVPVPCPPPEGAVADWITNARRSIEALGVYVGMGSASVTVDMLGEGGSEAASSDEDYDDDGEEAGEDEDAISPQDDEPPGTHQSGMSPASTTSTADGTPGRRSGGSAKLAILPAEDAPFGLMANLSLSMAKRSARRAVSREHDDDEVGLASRHYFRPSAYIYISLSP